MKDFKAMSERVARRMVSAEEDDDAALNNIDQALDAMIASIMAIEENLPLVKAETVPQKAALDSFRSLFDEAVKPYLADAVKALQPFDE